MPQSIGTMGRLIMNVAEMVLPEMLMNTVTRFMQDTNGLIYSGNNIFDKLMIISSSFSHDHVSLSHR